MINYICLGETFHKRDDLVFSHLANIMAVTILQKLKVLFVQIGSIESVGEPGKNHGGLG